MSTAPIVDPPEALVLDGRFQLGRFNAIPSRLNMLDVSRPYHYPVPRFIKKERLKEWQAFQFGNERWFFFTALYTARSLSLAIFYAYDRAEKKRIGFNRAIPGTAYKFHESLSNSRVGYHMPRAHYDILVSTDKGRIELDAGRISHDPGKAFSGHFSLDITPQASAPLAVCLPLGLNRAMYSTKVLMPMTGEFNYRGESFKFAAPDAMGIMDDHKGFYPWAMHYDWVSGFGVDPKGRRVGFNLTDNQVKDQERYNENCLWISNRVYSLPPVKVTRPAGPMGEWVIQDTEGLVDLIFVPEAPNDIRFNFGFTASDYHGPFGRFKGVIRNGTGEKIDAECLFGAGEQKYLRA